MNFFPKDSNNNMADLMQYFPIESNKIWHITDSNKAVAVYFSLQYYFATTESNTYTKGYAYLAEMSGCSVRWLTPTLQLLHHHKLIHLQVTTNGKNKASTIINKDTSVVSTRLLQERIQHLLHAKFSTYFSSQCRISELDSDIEKVSQVEPRKRTSARLPPPDSPPAACAASGGDERSLQNTFWGKEDPKQINGFYKSLKMELLKTYDEKEVEKLISRSLNSIRSRTTIKDLPAYLAAVKKTMIAKLARSPKKKVIAVTNLVELSQEEIATQKVREMTALRIAQLRNEGRSIFDVLEQIDRESGV